MLLLIDSVRSGSQRNIHSRNSSQIGFENGGQVATHASGSWVREGRQSMALFYHASRVAQANTVWLMVAQGRQPAASQMSSCVVSQSMH